MIALGIDPGTRNLGWGVVSRRGNRLAHVAHGVIRVGGQAALSGRLLAIAGELDRVIEAHAPDVGSVETIFFGKDASAAAKLGHARGVVLLCLERAGLTVCEHTPARVKRTVAGRGQADKRQVGMMVRAVLSLDELPPADASDALALAITQLRLDPRMVALGAKTGGRRAKMPGHLVRAIAEAREKAR